MVLHPPIRKTLRLPWSRALRRGAFGVILLTGACSDAEPKPSLSADVCGADAPLFRGLCVVTADVIHFTHAGPARSFTVKRSVTSAGKSSIEHIPEDKERYTLYLDEKERFARYSIFFSGSPALNLEFYHGTKIKPLTPKPAGNEDEIAMWWVSDDGHLATRMTFHGAAETYDLRTFDQTLSYQVDTTRLFHYGKHMLLRYSANGKKVERFFPEGNTAMTFVEADGPIHSFWRQGDQIAIQTEDGTISMPGLGLSHVFPLVYIAYADAFGIVAWFSEGTNCALTLKRFDWGGAAQTLATKSGLCSPLYAFSFLGNTLFGIVLKGKEEGAVFFGTEDLGSTWNFDGTMPYVDNVIGIARTNRLEYAYQNGTSLAEQGLLECASGAQDMNPNAGLSLYYETGVVLVDDVPEHLAEITTHQNIKTCYGH